MTSNKPPRMPPPGVPPLPSIPTPEVTRAPESSSPQAEDPAPRQPLPAAIVVTDGAAPIWKDPAPLAPPPEVKRDPDRTGRFIIVDMYPYNFDGKPNMPALARRDPGADHEYVGAILKASEGSHDLHLKAGATPYQTLSEWLIAQAAAFKLAGGDRYGDDWFLGFYHFLRFYENGATQGTLYVKTVEKTGGWDRGTIRPIVDVELGGISNPNHHASAQQVIDCACAFVERVKQLSGIDVIRYGRGALRDLKITHTFGTVGDWNASYTTKMHTTGLIPPGTLKGIHLWQYSDGNEGGPPGYPRRKEGFGKCDHSVFIDGADVPNLPRLRETLLARQG